MKKNQDSGSYMDGVRVKIAEEYKPPPKINIPMTHIQRLHFNKQIEDNLPKYDFSMENNVLQKVREWKTNRLAALKQREMRLEALDNEESDEEDEATQESADIPSTSSEIPINTTNYVTSYSNGMLLPTKVLSYYSNILQPIPLNNDTKNINSTKVKSPFNISEFEADTSSPFDNVALKSINEVEELAKVLKIEDETPKTTAVSYTNFQTFPNFSTSFIPNCSSSYVHPNGYYPPTIQSTRSYPTNYQCSPPNNYQTNYSSSFFQNDEKIVKISNLKPDKNVPSKSSLNNLPNPYDELPKNMQELADSISLMGFPLARVARTCKAIGDDNKKILDHLLAMSELLDLGFAEDKVSEALLLFDNDRDKALDKLIS